MLTDIFSELGSSQKTESVGKFHRWWFSSDTFEKKVQPCIFEFVLIRVAADPRDGLKPGLVTC